MTYLRLDTKYFLDKMVKDVSRKAFNGNLMRNLTLDLLDLSQVDHGAFRLSNEYFNLVATIEGAF